MNAEQAWQSALGQLQMEMPKASFDTWVRDTHLVSYKDGQFLIGVRNAYARDWLESRISSTVTRLLMGMMNRDISVSFNIPAIQEEEQIPEIDEEDGEDRTADGLDVEAVFATRYTEIVHPSQVVVVPAYILRLLWHQDVTPKQVSLWVGFHQAVYFQWRQNRRSVKYIPWFDVCEFSGMSRASYFREIGNESNWSGPLRGLIERIEQKNQRTRLENGTYNQRPNRYRVFMTPRLSRSDSAFLTELIFSQAAFSPDMNALEKAERVHTVLTVLKQRPVVSILPTIDDYPPASDEITPLTVMDIVRYLTGLEEDLPGPLQTIAEELQDAIIYGFGDLSIKHYFLTTVMPALNITHPRAWLIHLLRDRCYENPETGEVRDWTIVRGGYRVLAAWLGLTRVKTITDWMGDPIVSKFIQVIDPARVMAPEELKRAHLGTNDLFLHVELTEPLFQADPGESETPVEARMRLSTSKVEIAMGENETPVQAKVRLVPGANETQSGESETSVGAKVRLEVGAIETRNYYLKLPPELQKYPPTTLRPLQAKKLISPGSNNGWGWENLFTQNQVSAPMRQKILASNAEPWVFVSWLLYWGGPRGKGLEQPVGNALQHLLADPGTGATGAYDRLAKLPSRELKEILDDYLDPIRRLNLSEKVCQIFASSDLKRLRDVRQRLFGDEE